MTIIRTDNGAVPTTAPEPAIRVTWNCICHPGPPYERTFSIDQGREARDFAVRLKRNETVQPLTVHVNDT